MVLSLLVQWRYKYNTLPRPQILYNQMNNQSNLFIEELGRLSYHHKILDLFYQTKYNNNNIRVKLIIAPTLFIAVILIILLVVICNVIVRGVRCMDENNKINTSNKLGKECAKPIIIETLAYDYVTKTPKPETSNHKSEKE